MLLTYIQHQLTGMISKIYKNENFCRYMIREGTQIALHIKHKAVSPYGKSRVSTPTVEMLYKNVSLKHQCFNKIIYQPDVFYLGVYDYQELGFNCPKYLTKI